MDKAKIWKKFGSLWSTPARKTLFSVIGATAILLLVSIVFVTWDYGQALAADRLAYLKLYVSIFESIIIGLGVALAGVIIPAIFAESNEAFSRLKESRDFYSKAKTGIDYLPIRLCALSLKEASSLIQEVHYYKHQAELYPELRRHLHARYVAGDRLRNPTYWGNWMYSDLFELREVLEEYADRWDTMNPQERLAPLIRARPSVSELPPGEEHEMMRMRHMRHALRRGHRRQTTVT
jgi:hypothetical protein